MFQRIIVIFLLLSPIDHLYAQQSPQYTQYVYNSFLLNPAVAGIENYTDLRIGNRVQWKGLEGAPNTSYVSVHAPLGKDFLFDNANSISGQGDNPMTRSYLQNYQAASPHHGLGLSAIIDQAGPLKRTDVNASYAYHLGLSSKLNVSVGIGAGISQVAVDISKIVLEDNSDALLVNNNNTKIAPNLKMGIWLYGPRFYGGLSIHYLSREGIGSNGGSSVVLNKSQSQWFASAGYKLYLSENIAVFPTMLLNYTKVMPLSAEANLKVAFSDKFWLGGGYRRQDSFSANFGVNLGYLLNMAYAYDFTTSKLNTVTRGTHEFVLGILLNNRYRVNCPQKNW